MKAIEKVKQTADKHGWITTKYQYAIIREIMNDKGVDVTEEECREICNLQRYVRMTLGKDETALNLEAQWHNTPATREAENWESVFKSTAHPLQ